MVHPMVIKKAVRILPQRIVDVDGDTWEIDDDHLYYLPDSGPDSTAFRRQTATSIASHHGPVTYYFCQDKL